MNTTDFQGKLLEGQTEVEPYFGSFNPPTTTNHKK